MKKTSIKRMLTLVLLSVFILAASQIVLSENPDVYDFTITDGQATITGYLGDPPISGPITIPSSVMIESTVYPVIAIADYAFQNISGITQVVISNGITSIGAGAFYNCTGITSVTFPASLVTIKAYAFFGCTQLTAVSLPANLLTVEEAAFAGCSDLTAISIPANLTTLAPSLFSECTSLTSVDIPGTVTQIGDHAFFFCDNLAAANFLGNAPTIGGGVFDECASHFTVYYTPGATGFAAEWHGYPAEITPSHIVSFKDWDGTVLEQQKIGHGQPALTPPAPLRAGYSFTGWDKTFSAITTDLQVNAQYQINSFTITFDSAGGSSVASITQEFGTTVTAPADPTRTGYTFSGWNPSCPTSMPSGGATLIAQWTINQYSITFDSAGGSPIASIIQNFGSAVIAPANPTRSGYTFNGWNTAIPATMPVGGAALIAQWISGFPPGITSPVFSCNTTAGIISKINADTTVTDLLNNLNERQFIRVFRGESRLRAVRWPALAWRSG